MMNIFLENVQVIDLAKTLSNFTSVISFILLIVAGIGLIRIISEKGFDIVNIVGYIITCGLAIYLFGNIDKWEYIGEITYNFAMSVLNIINESKSMTNFKATDLLIGWWL
jgi:hypothetical protein